MKQKLTVAQAEVIYELANQGYAGGLPFQPHQAFPEHNNRHNAMRRTCRTLAKKGILETTQQPEVSETTGRVILVEKYTLPETALALFHDWASARNYDFSCFSDY